MKQVWGAPERNADAIGAVLADVLPASGLILEIASGSGQHAFKFAHANPGWRWQPTDRDPENLASIAGWKAEAPPNMLAPLRLDVLEEWPLNEWPLTECDAIVCINMIHISPFAATLALMAGAGRTLRPGSPLVTYGPYKLDGEHTAPSNEAFDRSLRSRNPDWGVRDVAEVSGAAVLAGLELRSRHAMPANNLCLVFERALGTVDGSRIER